MMHENFMRMALPVFVVCCLRMKFCTCRRGRALHIASLRYLAGDL